MAQEEYERLWDTLRSGEEWRGEFQNKKKNGELYWESASISPIRDEDGVMTHFIAVKGDITERKQAADSLQRAYDELDFRVQKRTSELTDAITALKKEIAQREQTVDALRESEEKFRNLVVETWLSSLR